MIYTLPKSGAQQSDWPLASAELSCARSAVTFRALGGMRRAAAIGIVRIGGSGMARPADDPMQLALISPKWRGALLSGVSLVAATTIIANVLRVFSTIVLTRVLSPADFGIAAITATIVTVLQMMSDIGFGIYVVRHQHGDDPRVLDVIWTVRLIRGVLLTALLLCLAAPLAWGFQKPELTAVIAVTALQLTIEGLASLAPLTKLRQQRLLAISVFDILTAIIQTGFGILLAVLIETYWAIVYAGLLTTVARVVLSYAMFPGSNRRPALERSEVSALLRFGRTVASAHAIHAFIANVDKVVLSRVFPLGTLGFYALGHNLASASAGFANLYPSRVLLPAFARTHREDPSRLAGTYYASRRGVTLLFMLASGMFVTTAPIVVDLLYDDRYRPVATFLSLLAISPAIAFNNFAAREVLMVIGRPHTLLVCNFVRLAWLAVVGMVGYLAYGPIGLVGAIGLVELPVQVYCWYELSRAGLFRMSEEAKILGAMGIGLVLGVLASSAYRPIAAGLGLGSG